MKFESTNAFLESSFQWAVDKTKQFLVTGIKKGDINRGDGGKWYGPNGVVIDSPVAEWAKPRDYIPAFWAGYFDRTAFYIRDFVHQAIGAHLVGYDEENFNMFYTFVSHANEQTGWFAPWAFNFDGSIYYMDTPNTSEFVREITAQFELVETAYSLYLWTGDERYIRDETIFKYIEKIMKEDCIDAFKIEGRTKSEYYVAVATRTYKMAILDVLNNQFEPEKYEKEIHTLKNRGFTDGYLISRPFEKNDTQNYITSIEQGTHQVQAFVEDGEFFKCKGKIVPNVAYELLMPLNAKVLECDNELGKIYKKDEKYFVEFKKIISKNHKEFKEIHSGNENQIKMPCKVNEFSFLRKEIE